MRTGTITFRIDSWLDDVFLVGLSVRAVCAALDFDEDGAGAVELAVVEAINNVVEHAYAERPGSPIEVELGLSDDTLRVDVRDQGRQMDWDDAVRRAAASADDIFAEGGRGLLIMQSLMDEIGYASRDGINTLTLIKRLPGVTPRAAAGRA